MVPAVPELLNVEFKYVRSISHHRRREMGQKPI